jgi:hypothetical protein
MIASNLPCLRFQDLLLRHDDHHRPSVRLISPRALLVRINLLSLPHPSHSHQTRTSSLISFLSPVEILCLLFNLLVGFLCHFLNLVMPIMLIPQLTFLAQTLRSCTLSTLPGPYQQLNQMTHTNHQRTQRHPHFPKCLEVRDHTELILNRHI